MRPLLLLLSTAIPLLACEPKIEAEAAVPARNGHGEDSGAPSGSGMDAGAGTHTSAGTSGLGDGGLLGPSFANGDCGQNPLTSMRTCRVGTITVTGMNGVDVYVEVHEPQPARPIIGTLLFHGGNGGDAFYSGGSGVDAWLNHLLNDLGYRVVRIRWDDLLGGTVNAGWTSGPAAAEGTFQQASLRVAKVLSALNAEYGAAPLCAVGHSGGSSAFAYALALHGAEELLDAVVLGGGPPMGSLGGGCHGDTDVGGQPLDNGNWRQFVNTLLGPNGVQDADGHRACANGNYVYELTNSTVDQPWIRAGGRYCYPEQAQPPRAPTQADWDRLESESIVRMVGGDYSHPNTPVKFVWGANDCAGGVIPPAYRYFQQLSASGTQTHFDIVPMAGHAVHSSAGGQASIESFLTAACR